MTIHTTTSPRRPSAATALQRGLILTTALLAPVVVAGMASADAYAAPTQVQEVTLYPQGATVQRSGSVDVQEGAHELVISDVPLGLDPQSLRVTVAGAGLDTVTFRDTDLAPFSLADTPEREAAEARVAEAERRIAAVEQEVALAEAKAQSALAKVAFYDKISASDTPAGELAQVAEVIGREGLAARNEAIAAQAEADAIRETLEPLDDDLEQAQAARDAVVQDTTARAQIKLSVTAPAAGTLSYRVSYEVQEAGWTPDYALLLTTQESPSLTLDRGARVWQATGETWRDVDVVLSTSRPGTQNAPSEVFPWVRRLGETDEPPMPAPRGLKMASGAEMMMSDAAPAPQMVARAEMQGITQIYTLPHPVTVGGAAGDLRFALDRLDLAPQVVARAVPLFDASAYLVAKYTNDSGEVILPGAVRLMRDGALIGESWLDLITPAQEVETGFGAIDGLTVRRTLLDRNAGDRGVIRRDTEEVEAWRLEVENNTDRLWDVELRDRVPVSEQDDLQISWSADPAPQESDIDDLRGVLGWAFDLPAGASNTVTLETTLRWPEGKVLR
ncbi:hypothetical protein AQS8620_00290 [Aquimixticola soesokkakensis]|uniref:DUF4139 domain-containing protein n=1 Tax=Aquimixticola soesokkakensis TaxID=1519096 RepID=A0A1Y5REP9_9RHOB|nr:DUF4139 domain-containing protein [Aquimixticola soesokkakensis]SLN15520.1 hypothetical protein AQS8620_00290 [Aquimixticola soesokkakensis]